MLKCIYVISTIALLGAICQMKPVQKKSIYSSLSGSVDQMIERVFTRIESWGDRFFDSIPFIGKKITRTQRGIIIMSTIITMAFVMGHLSATVRREYVDAMILYNRFDKYIRTFSFGEEYQLSKRWDAIPFFIKIIWILRRKNPWDLVL